QVAGNVLYLLLRRLFYLLPGPCAQLVDAWRGVILALVFGDAVQGVDANVQYVIVLEYQLNSFLHPAVDLNLLQPAKPADAMVCMYNIITRVEISQLSYGHAVTTSEEAPDTELVITVKDLMISVNG